MQAIRVTLTPVLDADGISQSQTPAAGGVQTLLLNGALASSGSVTFSTAHLISITSAGNDTSKTFVVTGEDDYGSITESITGANASAATGAKYFLKVTSITVSGNTAAAITVGVDGKCASKPTLLDYNKNTFQVNISCVLTGTLTYTAQHTVSDVQTYGVRISDLYFFDHDDSSLVGATTSKNSNYSYPIIAVRVKVTAFTSGVLNLALLQAG